MDITNKTRKPLRLPLPGGKRLFLGPGKTGQVSPKALEHPPLVKLLEAGDRIEVVEAFESIDTNPEQFTNGMKGIINVRAPIPLHATHVVQGNRSRIHDID